MAIDQENFCRFRDELHRRAAIVLGDQKQYLVEARLGPIAKKVGMEGVNELIASLRYSPYSLMWHEIVDAMTTNETSFFRDSTPFYLLQDAIFPRLLERRNLLKTIRVWSAGCSSGQEPYSIAMLWKEKFSHLTDWNLKIYASDLSSTVLNIASKGEYSRHEVERGLTEKQQHDHFDRIGDRWIVKPSLKSMIEFEQQNLIDRFPSTVHFDIVLIRNVMVYFDLSTKQNILRRVREVMAEDGCLLLGGAETTIMVDDAFQQHTHGNCSFYRLKKDD